MAQLHFAIDYGAGVRKSFQNPEATFDIVFSYSVPQHLAKERVIASIGDIDRVHKRGELVMAQMLNRLGIRCLYHRGKRRFRAELNFEVRYSGLRELRDLFGAWRRG